MSHANIVNSIHSYKYGLIINTFQGGFFSTLVRAAVDTCSSSLVGAFFFRKMSFSSYELLTCCRFLLSGGVSDLNSHIVGTQIFSPILHKHDLSKFSPKPTRNWQIFQSQNQPPYYLTSAELLSFLISDYFSYFLILHSCCEKRCFIYFIFHFYMCSVGRYFFYTSVRHVLENGTPHTL